MNANIFAKLTPALTTALAKTNGKKSITGGIITALGLLCIYLGLEDVGTTALSLGIPLLIAGLGHKVLKARNKRLE